MRLFWNVCLFRFMGFEFSSELDRERVWVLIHYRPALCFDLKLVTWISVDFNLT